MSLCSDKSRPNHVLDKIIGKSIRELRESKGITRKKLADKVVISEKTLKNHEEGTYWVSAGRLILISRALEVKPAYFYQKFNTKTISDAFRNSLGFKIRELRIAQQLTGNEVAHFLGMSLIQYYNYESDKTLIPVNKLVKLSKLFNVEIKTLLDGIEFEEDEKENSIEDEDIKKVSGTSIKEEFIDDILPGNFIQGESHNILTETYDKITKLLKGKEK